MTPKEVIDQLGYGQVPENWVTEDNSEPATAHLWRSAKKAHVLGTYVFRASPKADPILPPRPAIHVARANNETEAREIHRNLWNLGAAPFLIVILPHQVRVYSGFNYSQKKQNVGLLCIAELTHDEISTKLRDFYAEEIDSGRIWQTQAENLTPDKRVDRHLLKNLEKLGNELADEKYKIDQVVAHALIGKYIYLRYLGDRKILSDEWLGKHGIGLEDVTGRNASLASLRKLTEALEDRFNGGIFPLSFTGSKAPSNDAVKYVASVFRGDDPTSGQLALDFKAYDFSYIPIETLSSIYEQFLHAEGKGKREGAIYTREFVADYLLCELNSIKPLKRGMKVLDPACGSGIFLVLAYRRLIEGELSKRKKKRLSPDELCQILEESIFGVERSREACYVTEFSLILTLLSYVEPPELHENENFKFPDLHNRHIFKCDFFNNNSKFWKKNLTFDWILGNPPWNKLESATAAQEQKHAWKWLTDKSNSKLRPVGKYSLCEAFSWKAIEFLNEGGHVGFLIHATSLFNSYSTKYRQEFFKQHEIKRITNFANLAYILFAGRAQAPAATIIYTKAEADKEKVPIIHYGPFVVNQVLNRSLNENTTKKPTWTLTIYEDEIQTVDSYEAEVGEALTWKLALWGTYRDNKAINSLKRIFPQSLNDIKKKREWKFHQGVELRNGLTADNNKKEETEYDPKLADFKLLNVDAMSGGFYLTVPESVLYDIPKEKWYIRTRGGKAGLAVAKAPHIFWSPTFAAYSDIDFVLPAPQVGLSATSQDKDYLRAVSAYLNSSFGKYLLFFYSASWGIDRNKFAPADAENIPLPDFSDEQVKQLADLHRELTEVKLSGTEDSLFNEDYDSPKMNLADIKNRLDNETERILRIPEYVGVLARDFIQVRYQFNKGKMAVAAARPATNNDLLRYAKYLTQELDNFAEIHHKVSVKQYSSLVICTVEITRSRHPFEPVIEDARGSSSLSLKKLWRDLEQRFSQWVYIQRGLRVFSGRKVHIYKSPRLVDWTRTQALLDADDIIAEVLNNKGDSR